MNRRETFKSILLYPLTLLTKADEPKARTLLIEDCKITGKEILIPGGNENVDHVVIRHSTITVGQEEK